MENKQEKPVYLFDETNSYILGIHSVKEDPQNKTLTFIYKESDDSHYNFNESDLEQILKKYPNHNIYVLEESGNYFTDRIKVKDITDSIFYDDSMEDRIDINF